MCYHGRLALIQAGNHSVCHETIALHTTKPQPEIEQGGYSEMQCYRELPNCRALCACAPDFRFSELNQQSPCVKERVVTSAQKFEVAPLLVGTGQLANLVCLVIALRPRSSPPVQKFTFYCFAPGRYRGDTITCTHSPGYSASVIC